MKGEQIKRFFILIIVGLLLSEDDWRQMRARRGCRILLALLLCLVIITGLWLYVWLFYDLPSPNDFDSYVVSSGASNYTPVSLSEIPDELRWATIAAEDVDFYIHPSNTDLRSILRVIWFSLQRDKYTEDGRTITQELVTNLMLASGEPIDDSLRHRMRESTLGILITRRYTKDEVLEFYLNSIHYSNGVYGAGDAAQLYYDKQVNDLGLAECAMLVYISHLSDFSPLENLESAKQGQANVLEFMIEAGYISTEEAQIAMKEPLVFVHQQ